MQALSILAVAVFCAAAISDILSRRIPNALPGTLALLALIRIGINAHEGVGAVVIALDVTASLILLGLGALLFHARLLGGGDVKLLASAALWVGFSGLVALLFLTVVSGGVLALAVLVWGATSKGLLNRHACASLPYGVAIAFGGVAMTLPNFA